jgi:hypothetical protein
MRAALALLVALTCYGQRNNVNGTWTFTTTIPTGTCNRGQAWVVMPAGDLYTCVNGTPTKYGGGSGSGVSSFSGDGVLISNSLSTGAVTAALANATQNLVFASPNGSTGTGSYRALVGPDLPVPGAASLGGTFSLAAVSHKYITSITTAGQPVAAQPVCADLSDSGSGCNSAAGVPTTRNVNTSSPLTGGGALSSDLMLACAACGVTGSPLSQFASTTSAQLRGIISDETGSGAAVFAGGAIGAATVTAPATGDASARVPSTQFVATAIQNAIAGVNPAVAVQACTTAAGDTSGFTYNNGVAGVGAFFTGAVNTAITIDGFTFTALGQRLLVKNDTQSPSGAFNGVYYVTTLQALAVAPVLTRALDYDQPSDINNTGAIPCVNGSSNGGTSWYITSTVSTIGTDPLTYTKYTLNPNTIVTASSPGAGIAHFPGSTQSVTSSPVSLTADVSGVLPALNGGGMVMLEAHTASSSATLDFTTCIQSGYDDYQFRFTSIIPGTTGQDFQLLGSVNGGSSYLGGTSYEYAFFNGNTNSAVPTVDNSTGAAAIRLAVAMSTAVTLGLSGHLDLHDPLNTSTDKSLEIQLSWPIVFKYYNLGSAFIDTTSAVNAIRFQFSSGAIASGVIRCYGFQH